MFLKIRPLLYSLVFFAGLELIAAKPEYFALTLLFLFAISLVEGKKIGTRWIFSILPVFFSLTAASLLYLVSLQYEKQIFIFLSSGIYYLALFSAYRLGLYGGDQTARGMNMAATAATIFFIYTGAYGFYLNFLVPLYYLMLAYLVGTLLVSYQYFSIIRPDNKKNIWTYSFLLSLVMAEIIWAMNFWPFGYLTTGVCALILYYVLWDLAQSHFLNLLSKKRVIANMALFSALIIMVILSSKWIPVI